MTSAWSVGAAGATAGGRAPRAPGNGLVECDQRRDDQGHHTHELHEDVERRASRILEGVAHGVADNSSVVCFRTLGVHGTVNLGLVATVLEGFLGIVPSATGVGHEDCQGNTGDGHSSQQSTECFCAHTRSQRLPA